MTSTLGAPAPLDVDLEQLDDVLVGARNGSEPQDAGEDQGDGTVLRVSSVIAAAALSSGAAAWLGGSLVRGFAPRAIALLGVAIGAGLVALSQRLSRPVTLQYATVPLAAVVGAVLVAPAATGGTANLPGLVGEALTSGGLLQPPIPFDPGWRFLLVVVFAITSTAAATIALSARRSWVAVAVPLPLVVGAALLQPPDSAMPASMAAVFLVIGALAVAQGASGSTDVDAASGRRFQARRLARGVALLVGLMVAIVGLNQADVLFPATEDDRVIPPQKPPKVPLEKDREIFQVTSDSRGPWRVGVLDVYDGTGWLLPSLDPRRVVDLPPGGAVPGAPAGTGEPVQTRFRVVDLRGRSLPIPYGAATVAVDDGALELDPRTGVPALAQRVPTGLTYEVTSAPLPTGARMNAAPAADPRLAAEFTAAPPAPDSVVALLAGAPDAPFDRLQMLRDRLYTKVVASGGGTPVDIDPERVGVLVEADGTEATPFEITAAEALLARWAGVPARIGFGYFGGEPVEGGFSYRPKHGAAWLEAYFEGLGWVPLVGTPPQAKASLDDEDKKEDAAVQPTDELAATVLIPIRRRTAKQLFELIRYWVLVALPWVLATITVVVAHPVLLKALRRRRRRRWALAEGPGGQVAVAYAELRDWCQDLNVGDVRDTPLEFVARFTHDAEHDELAWLVSRLLWGDLRRDARPDDATAAEALVESVRRRIAALQPPTNRVIAAVSRASLRDPWADDIPNVDPGQVVRRAIRRILPRRRSSTAPRRGAVLGGAGAATVLLVVTLVLGGCAGDSTAAKAPSEFPDGLVPEPPGQLLGYELHREPTAETAYDGMPGEALISRGRFYSIRRAELIEGSVQVGLLRPEVDGSSEEVQREIERGVGGRFETVRVGPARVRRRSTPEQDLNLWFPPERNVMVVIVLRKRFEQRDDMVRAVVAHARGIDAADLVPLPTPPTSVPSTGGAST